MANVDAAFGFVPVRHLSGSGSCRTNKYTIASGLAENIFNGDLCIIDANGQITPHTATEVNNIGVFGGVSYTDSIKFSLREPPPRRTSATVLMLLLVQAPQRLANLASKHLAQ